MRICFLVGSADISGGTFVIFQHAVYLQEQGHDVLIATMFPVSEAVPDWHPAMARLSFTSIDAVRGRFDLAVATWWKTVYELHKVAADRYAYFVQSIESRFYPEAEAPLRSLVDETYKLRLPMITEATWIKQHLLDAGAPSVALVRNGVLKQIYREDGPVEAPRVPGVLRILVEGSLGVPFKNVPRTLRMCTESNAGAVWLLTITDVGDYPNVDRVISRVPVARTAEVYRSCDVLVKLSYVEGMFGPPLEMFHCGGTAITYDVSGHDEYIVNGENALVVSVDDEEGVVSALRRLAEDPETLARLKDGARRTAAEWPSWEQSSEEFTLAVERILQLPSTRVASFRPTTERAWERYVTDERLRLSRSPVRRAMPRFKQYVRVNHAGAYRFLAAAHYSWTAGRRGPWRRAR